MDPARVVAGRYELLAPLGQGGMGEVHRARHVVTNRLVALKRLHPALAARHDVVARLIQEARAAAELRHPSIVQVLDADDGASSGDAFIVMELLDGESLGQRLARNGMLTWNELAPVVLPIIDALALVHAHGIVHRDIKPDNIFLASAPDGSCVPTLLDFGIAKVQHAKLTSDTQSLGTPCYMSPEQFAAAARVDGRADVWSMGVLMYECLTGSLPFDGSNHHAIIAAVMSNTRSPMRPSAGVPREVAEAVERCLSIDPRARFDMRELGDVLRSSPAVGAAGAAEADLAVPHAKTQPRESAPPSVQAAAESPPPRRPGARHSARSSYAVAGVAGGAFIGAFLWWRLEQGRAAMHVDTPARPAAVAPPSSFPTASPAAAASPGRASFTRARAPLGSSAEQQREAQRACVRELGRDQCLDALFAREVEHSAELAPFALDEREVTGAAVAAWLNTLPDLRIVRDEHGTPVVHTREGDPLVAVFDEARAVGAPVEGAVGSFRAHGEGARAASHVTWFGAGRYCAAHGGRLPSADEWEFAARGLEARVYPWGAASPDCERARYGRAPGGPCAAAGAGPAAAGSSAGDVTPLGVLDLAGNVGEWTSTRFDDEASAACRDPQTCFVYKGGDHASPSDRLRSAVVSRAPANKFFDHVGFRCAGDGVASSKEGT